MNWLLQSYFTRLFRSGRLIDGKHSYSLHDERCPCEADRDSSDWRIHAACHGICHRCDALLAALLLMLANSFDCLYLKICLTSTAPLHQTDYYNWVREASAIRWLAKMKASQLSLQTHVGSEDLFVLDCCCLRGAITASLYLVLFLTSIWPKDLTYPFHFALRYPDLGSCYRLLSIVH